MQIFTFIIFIVLLHKRKTVFTMFEYTLNVQFKEEY